MWRKSRVFSRLDRLIAAAHLLAARFPSRSITRAARKYRNGVYASMHHTHTLAACLINYVFIVPMSFAICVCPLQGFQLLYKLEARRGSRCSPQRAYLS